MGVAFHTSDLPQILPVMQAAETSLTFLVQDLQSQAQGESAAGNIESWINALHRQGRPLVASSQGRADLEAWLALVEA